jgi:hypothetical protein
LGLVKYDSNRRALWLDKVVDRACVRWEPATTTAILNDLGEICAISAFQRTIGLVSAELFNHRTFRTYGCLEVGQETHCFLADFGPCWAGGYMLTRVALIGTVTLVFDFLLCFMPSALSFVIASLSRCPRPQSLDVREPLALAENKFNAEVDSGQTKLADKPVVICLTRMRRAENVAVGRVVILRAADYFAPLINSSQSPGSGVE